MKQNYTYKINEKGFELLKDSKPFRKFEHCTNLVDIAVNNLKISYSGGDEYLKGDADLGLHGIWLNDDHTCSFYECAHDSVSLTMHEAADYDQYIDEVEEAWCYLNSHDEYRGELLVNSKNKIFKKVKELYSKGILDSLSFIINVPEESNLREGEYLYRSYIWNEKFDSYVEDDMYAVAGGVRGECELEFSSKPAVLNPYSQRGYDYGYSPGLSDEESIELLRKKERESLEESKRTNKILILICWFFILSLLYQTFTLI